MRHSGDAIPDTVEMRLALRARPTLRARVDRITDAARLRARQASRPVLQAAIAAMVAWSIAHGMHHEEPVLAAMTAVSVVGISLEARSRKVMQNVVGVALGVLVADTIIARLGTGAWQLGVTVAAAMMATIIIDAGSAATASAASSAAVIATIAPPTAATPLHIDRFEDAAIGGIVGLIIATWVLPANPLRTVRRAADPLFESLSVALLSLAEAVGERDADAAFSAMVRARGLQVSVDQLSSVVDGARETARLSPVFRASRDPLESYAGAMPHVDNAVRNVRVAARQAAGAMQHHEPLPTGLPESLRASSAALLTVARDIGTTASVREARSAALEAAELASEATFNTSGVHGHAVATMVRAIAVDVLYMTGMTYREAQALMPDLPAPRSRRQEG